MKLMLNEYKFRDNEERNIFIFRFIILFVLWIWAFWSNITIMANVAINTSEMAHNLIFPIAVILLIYRRRSELLYNINRGSNWGLAIMIVGIIVSAASAWPFSFGYIQQLAIVPILAGAIIAALGWKVFKISVPMLILIILAIPIGVRLYASLIIIPETITISAVSKTLSLIGINANISGTDIIYSSGQNAGILAMGESNRGSRLLLAYAFIGVFVIFYEHRTVWKIIIPIIVSIPIIFLCNFIRLLTWGLIVICRDLPPTSSIMRNTSAIISLTLCCLFFKIVCSFNFGNNTGNGNVSIPADN